MPRQRTKSLLSINTDLDGLLFNILLNIAAILVSTGYGFSRVNRLAKIAFVQAATSADRESSSRLSIARIAALTGLTRTEVSQIVRAKNGKAIAAGRSTNRVTRVASGWVEDKRFSQKRARPRPLEFSGSGNTFTELARQYSGDIPPKALLTEMIRLGLARQGKHGKVIFVRSDVVHSRRTTAALKAVIPMISFLAKASTTQTDTELTSRTDKIEIKFSSLPQVFAAIRELQGRHRAFVAALEGLGSRVDGQTRYAINVSVAVAATNPRASTAELNPISSNRESKARK
jgi:hypothetical protein